MEEREDKDQATTLGRRGSKLKGLFFPFGYLISFAFVYLLMKSLGLFQQIAFSSLSLFLPTLTFFFCCIYLANNNIAEDVEFSLLNKLLQKEGEGERK